MLTLSSLFKSIRLDLFTSVHLKDAFFHVPIVERHRNYLRVPSGGRRTGAASFPSVCLESEDLHEACK